MMGRRYYCDYCDKVFIDDVEARKKHLNSTHHLKLRKLHYDNYRDLRTVLAEESSKMPCRRFLGNGFCQFESNCKYTHYSPEQLWELKQTILMEEQKEFHKQCEIMEIPSAEAWIEKYNLQKHSDKDEYVSTTWSYPEYLLHRQDLPPSMRKFRPEEFTDSEFEQWG